MRTLDFQGIARTWPLPRSDYSFCTKRPYLTQSRTIRWFLLQDLRRWSLTTSRPLRRCRHFDYKSWEEGLIDEILQRQNSMLSFEKEPFQGTQNILEKLGVSASLRRIEEITHLVAELAIPEGPAPCWHGWRTALKWVWRYFGLGDWSPDGMFLVHKLHRRVGH